MGADHYDEGRAAPAGITRRRGAAEEEEDEFKTTTFPAREKGALERNLSKKEKAKELWSTVKHQLVEFSALPEYLQDNAFIERYYRADWSFKHSFYSLFSMHNETLNVWS